LGAFRLEREGEPVELGAKPPTRALDILRFLAIAKDHACSLEALQDWLWPDLEGDRAKAACEQALHRLRRLLGRADLIVQREGGLRLAPGKVWVDLADWEARLKQAGSSKPEEATRRLEAALLDFPGPPLGHGRMPGWALPATEHVRGEFVDAAVQAGRRYEASGEAERARAIYLRALEHYPDAARIYEALIRECAARADAAAAMEHYARYERTLQASGGGDPSPTIRMLVQPFIKPARANMRA
jgi:DNA-binding SARP family transcriptional activator